MSKLLTICLIIIGLVIYAIMLELLILSALHLFYKMQRKKEKKDFDRLVGNLRFVIENSLYNKRSVLWIMEEFRRIEGHPAKDTHRIYELRKAFEFRFNELI
jgi:hypothetical protein